MISTAISPNTVMPAILRPATASAVFVFFGKSGVIAYDLQGKKLWIANVGKESSDRRWGSGASLILCGDLLIVNASEESNSIRAFDKRTGKQVWKAEAKLLELAYDTPALVTTKAGKADLVIAVAGEVWGLDPDRGKLRCASRPS